MSKLIPDLRESFPACKRRSERVTRRVGGIKAFAEALATYRPHEATFFEKVEAWLTAKRDKSISLGLQHDAEVDLDNELRMVAFVLRAVDGGSRRSALVQEVYPDGYGRALRRGAPEALRIATGVLQGIDEKDHPDIVARRQPLTNVITALQSAITACDLAYGALAQAKAALVAERRRWRHAFIAFYFDCVKVFPERRTYVNRQFRVAVARRVEDEEVEPEPEPEPDPEGDPGLEESARSGPGEVPLGDIDGDDDLDDVDGDILEDDLDDLDEIDDDQAD